MNECRNKMKPEVRAYLERIEYEGPVDVSAAALADLQECHLHAVPYENLDILRRVPLSLHIPDLFDKIVVRRRGGYCFELNALFGWLLRELGYPVTDLMSRFWRDEPNPPPKRRHHVLKVEAGGAFYLCDVGVGGIVPRQPIQMAEGLEHQQGEECYRLVRDPEYGWMLCELKRGEWCQLYSFTEEPQLAKDFIMATYWCENAPDSIFIQDAMVAIRTREGRSTVAGREFRIYASDQVSTFIPQTEAEYEEALRSYFGISLNEITV
ncbi:arylamine N-acetyltransferase family protein [Paenibacillus apiarius]|uniref:Arylamine N-acetyltransferase n=1 Tax=Paenibacillus apiarius TaxID=46240 RepID=A0ABT4DNK8_9BACL|nr:arylamine N-acetyltransferase [Paenibacillus apiarius]MCY9512963.1 arylamine N-acetyltransferase [Paenibacillus apiarius]MCY9518947.1 arylamine N-acetyltransferase [Paenibacillus apiarius]MCY9550756.1 arylamine N-acetyltransferase [Paenibacillus apiarius]MCY9559810.1 arylamine N-acetyltransferase [Paenibacillus apiarius]MCY9682053.1 arylamine N-acetyltransferase [Paenibacillus apiarius]